MQFVFQTERSSSYFIKFSLWIMQLMNHIDQKFGKAIYFMPETFVNIPYELFRVVKRSDIDLLEEEGKNNKESELFVYGTEGKSNLFNGFSNELATFISRHFYDPLIANPDLKEQYLTRLNIMLQYSKYFVLFE